MSTNRGAVCRAWAAIVAVALSAVAWAHEGGAVDLEAMEAHVAARAVDGSITDAAVRKAYAKLNRKLDKPSRRGLASDLAKLSAASSSSNGILAADGELRGHVDAALDAVHTELSAQPDEIASLVQQIASAKQREKVEAVVLRARDLTEEGRALRNTGDEAAALKKWRKAQSGFRDACARARAFVKRQGGGRPQFKAAMPGQVYTVVGTGQGGFNGDGREARRSTLYFVEECRLGPDGLLYVLDWNNHMLRRVEADGRLARVCGEGTPGDSEGDPLATQLNHPSSLAFHPTDGRVFIAAWHNHKVKVFDPRGAAPTVYTIAGGPAGTGGDGGLATDARFNLLPGLVRLPDGDLLVADAGNQVVRRIDLSDAQSAPNIVGTVVDTGTIERVAGTPGVAGNTGDDGDARDATLNFSRAQNAEPDGRMEISPDGSSVYVVCGQAHCVRKIDLASGRITRFAGVGTAGYSGDGGQAVDAQLNRPSDVAVAADGTVFISDSYNNVIRRVAPDGTISTYAGSPTGSAGFAGDEGDVSAAVFHHPAGIELDADGNLYVCDRVNHRVRVIASADPGALLVPETPYVFPTESRGAPPAKGPSGTIDTYAGTGEKGFNGDGLAALDTNFYWPQDVALDPAAVPSLLHLVDWNNHRVRRIDADGTVATVVGSGELGDEQGPATEVNMNHPTDLAFHPVTGELWIAGWHTDKLLRLDAATNAIAYAAGGPRAFRDDVAVASAWLSIPSSIKFNSDGDWFVGDQGNQRIRFADSVDAVMTTIGGDGTSGFAGDEGPAASARFSFPTGQNAQPAGRICLDPTGRYVYVADTGNHRVRRIDLADPQRTITTVAGTGTPGFSGDGGSAAGARLNAPVDVDCDASGDLYIVDRDNHAVRKVTIADGTIRTVAGTGLPGYSGDTAAAVQAELQRPCGIFVVRSGPTAGRLYIADTFNSVIRVVWE